MADIPEWNDSMSDGCSCDRLPSWLSFLYAPKTQAQRMACLAHDRDYYYGGSRRDRRMADWMFRTRSLAAGTKPWLVKTWWVGVRLFGGPHLHRFTTWVLGRPQAWAWGGGVFKYTN